MILKLTSLLSGIFFFGVYLFFPLQFYGREVHGYLHGLLAMLFLGVFIGVIAGMGFVPDNKILKFLFRTYIALPLMWGSFILIMVLK